MAHVREVEVSLGLSVDKNGVWVKGSTKVTVAMEKGEDVQACFARAFELADESLEEKMNEYLYADGDKK